jgi:Ankyrin repeats (3 copies)
LNVFFSTARSILTFSSIVVVASKNGHIQVGCLLLDHGAEPYWYNEIGRTALEDSKDCITEQALLAHYEKLQQGAVTKRLQHSSSGGRSRSGVCHILPRNDSLNDFLNEEQQQDSSRSTTSQNSDNAAEQGLDEEPTSNQEDIIQATIDGDVEIVRKLLDGNMDFVNNHYDNEAGTLLHIACRRNQVNVAKLLLDKGIVDVNGLDGEGLTALHIASELGFSDLIKLLLDHNADVMIQDPDCRTPFDIAKDDATLRVLLDRTRELDVVVVSVLDHVGEHEKRSAISEEAEEVEATDTESTSTDGYYARFELLMQQHHEEQQTVINKLQNDITLLLEKDEQHREEFETLQEQQAIIGKLKNDITSLLEKDEQRQEEFETLQACVAALEEQLNEQKQNANSCEQNSKLIREQSMDLEDLEERLARVEDGLQETQLNLVLQQQQQQQPPQQLQKQKQHEPAQQDDEQEEEQMTPPEETGLLEAENTLLKVENENQKFEIALLKMKVAEYAQLEQEQAAQQKWQEKLKEKEKQEKKEKEKDLLLFNLNSSMHGIVHKPLFENKKPAPVFNEPRPEYEEDDNNSNGGVINKKLLGFSMDNGKSLLFSFPDFFGEAEAEEKRKAEAASASAAADAVLVDNARTTPEDQSLEKEPRVEV